MDSFMDNIREKGLSKSKTKRETNMLRFFLQGVCRCFLYFNCEKNDDDDAYDNDDDNDDEFHDLSQFAETSASSQY